MISCWRILWSSQRLWELHEKNPLFLHFKAWLISPPLLGQNCACVHLLLQVNNITSYQIWPRSSREFCEYEVFSFSMGLPVLSMKFLLRHLALLLRYRATSTYNFILIFSWDTVQSQHTITQHTITQHIGIRSLIKGSPSHTNDCLPIKVWMNYTIHDNRRIWVWGRPSINRNATTRAGTGSCQRNQHSAALPPHPQTRQNKWDTKVV